MPRSRLAAVSSVAVSIGVLAFLWTPILHLYGAAIWEILASQPARLLEVFPVAPVPRALFLNTLLLSVSTALLSLLLGASVAGFLARLENPVAALGFALPLAVSPTLMATAYLEISRTPPARAAASLAADHTLSINSIFITAPVMALCFYPLAAFALAVARRMIPAELEDAALLFGGRWMAARRVLWPLLAPALLAAAGMIAALAMWEMGAPDLLDVRTYSVQIYRDFSARQDAAKAALDAAPMFVLGALCFLPALHALRFYRGLETLESKPRRRARHDFSSVAAFLAAGLIFLSSPLAPLLVFVSQLQSPAILPEIWEVNRDEIFNTLIVATVASLLLAALGTSLAALWREYSPRAGRVLLPLFLMSLLCAPIMLAIAFLNFFNQPLFDALYDSRYGLLVCGLLARFGPLGVLWLHEAMRRVPHPYEEAAAGLGASGARVFLTITTPLLAPATLGLLAVAWALCASELSLSVLLNAPGGQTLPVPIFNQMHIGATAEVAALSLTLVALNAGVLCALLAATRILHRIMFG